MKRIIAIIIVLCLLITGLTVIPELSQKEMGDQEEKPVGTRATLIVGPGQTYTKIQDALNASNSGDIINVLNGTYNEQITINVFV